METYYNPEFTVNQLMRQHQVLQEMYWRLHKEMDRLESRILELSKDCHEVTFHTCRDGQITFTLPYEFRRIIFDADHRPSVEYIDNGTEFTHSEFPYLILDNGYAHAIIDS